MRKRKDMTAKAVVERPFQPFAEIHRWGWFGYTVTIHTEEDSYRHAQYVVRGSYKHVKAVAERKLRKAVREREWAGTKIRIEGRARV